MPSDVTVAVGTGGAFDYRKLKVDSSGYLQVNVAAGGSSGTQYTEDVASVADPIGTQLNLRRRDSLSSETTTDGDNTAANCTAKGELYVKHSDSIAVTGTFFQATQPVSIAGTVTVSGPLTDTQLRASAVPVSGTFFQVTQPVSIAAGATSIGKAEDVASADADVGVPALAVRKATPANTSGTDGDYEFLQMSAGRLWTSSTIDAALPAGANAIGKLAANSGVIIGAVEIAAAQTLATVTTVSTVTSVTAIANALPAGTNILGGTIPSPSSSSSFAPTRAVSTAYEASRVVKASAGNLYRLWGYSSRTTEQFIQIHNTASVPADTAVPILFALVQGKGNFSFDFVLLPEQFGTGISVCNSSTGPTKTIGSADTWFFASYS